MELSDFYNRCTYQVLYVDNVKHNAWTVPVMLTQQRAEKFCNDYSVKSVRLITKEKIYELDLVDGYKPKEV